MIHDTFGGIVISVGYDQGFNISITYSVPAEGRNQRLIILAPDYETRDRPVISEITRNIHAPSRCHNGRATIAVVRKDEMTQRQEIPSWYHSMTAVHHRGALIKRSKMDPSRGEKHLGKMYDPDLSDTIMRSIDERYIFGYDELLYLSYRANAII